MKNANLLIIDPQKCFTTKAGALFVPNADVDVVNIANMIRNYIASIESIAITGDFHPSKMISFPNYWVDAKGNHPTPFTVITVADIINGVWKPVDACKQEWGLYYTKQLDENNKTKNNNFFDLRIWPYHAIAGTDGANFDPVIMDALAPYMEEKVTVVMKGQNPDTEQQGALEADVPVPGDNETVKNSQLVNWIDNAITQGGDIIACGEALDICFAYTIYSILNYVPAEFHNRIVILADCASPIYPELGERFIDDMKTKYNLRVTTSTEYFKVA